MAKKTININGTATQMVNDINSNFDELYQGAGGGGSVSGLPTKRVRVYDVIKRAWKSGGAGTVQVPVTITAGTKYVIEKAEAGANWGNMTVAIAGGSSTQTLLTTNVSQVVTSDKGFGEEIEATVDGTMFTIYSYQTGLINIYHYEDVPTTGASRWLGKKWLVIGDSISTIHADEADVSYSELVAKSMYMHMENVAVSGKNTLNYIDGFSVNGRNYKWDAFSTEYDLVTVMLGANDQGYNCPVGVIGDTGTGTFIGRLKTLYNNLRGRYPKSVIAFITPIKRYTNSGEVYTNTQGLSTEPYAQAMRDVCNLYSIPCIDLYYCIDPSTQTARDNFFIESGGSHDGTHPNDVGHALFIAPIVEARLRDIAPFYFNDWT